MLLDPAGRYLDGSLRGKAAERAILAAAGQGKSGGRYYFLTIARSDGYCVLGYQMSPQYQHPRWRQLLPAPQPLLLLLATLGLAVILMVVAARFGRALNQRLAPLTAAANNVQQQVLDFTVAPSGITEIDALGSALDDMRAALKTALEQQWRSEQEKNRQMSALAHDLKTPLTIIRGNAELLMEADLPAEQHHCAAYIASSALQMQRYVQTLIEVARAWQGDAFHPQLCHSAPLLADIRQQAQGLCALKEQTLRWQSQCRAAELCVDRDLFIRAITNIVDNAAHHTPVGGTISVTITEDDGFLTLTISDTGPGFTPEALRRACEPFYTDDASRHTQTHFGIGLYAAQTIIQKHGGRLRLANAPTGGAQVTVWLPSPTKSGCCP